MSWWSRRPESEAAVDPPASDPEPTITPADPEPLPEVAVEPVPEPDVEPEEPESEATAEIAAFESQVEAGIEPTDPRTAKQKKADQKAAKE